MTKSHFQLIYETFIYLFLLCLGLIINHYMIYLIWLRGIFKCLFSIKLYWIFKISSIFNYITQVRWNNCCFWLFVTHYIGWVTDDSSYNVFDIFRPYFKILIYPKNIFKWSVYWRSWQLAINNWRLLIGWELMNLVLLVVFD